MEADFHDNFGFESQITAVSCFINKDGLFSAQKDLTVLANKFAKY